jgi:hypothetical protein
MSSVERLHKCLRAVLLKQSKYSFLLGWLVIGFIFVDTWEEL